jgi:hypothetical protein
MNRSVAAALLVVLSALPLRGDPNDTKRDSKPYPFVLEALKWLPVDVETVIVFQGSFEFDTAFNESEPTPVFQSLPLNLVTSIRKGMLRNPLQGQKVAFAVEGSRRFRSPSGLGMGPFDGCQILRFKDGADDAAKIAFQFCRDHADAKAEVGGRQVAVFKEKWEEDDWTLLVTQPRPQVLLCATDRTFLEEVLKRMDGKPEGRALPEDLSEWQHVNATAPVWAVRHYRKETNSEAIGFVFWYDPKSANPLVARYLSKAGTSTQVFRGFLDFPKDNLKPEITVVAPGVVEVSANAGAKDGWATFLLLVLDYLGHAVNI